MTAPTYTHCGLSTTATGPRITAAMIREALRQMQIAARDNAFDEGEYCCLLREAARG